jgi:hypothetical protein
MKKTVIALFAIVAFAGTAFAADVMTFSTSGKKEPVSFNHKTHQEKLGGDCTKCHATKAGGKIEGFGKDFAHKTCKGCHAEMGKGPKACGECHKK